MQVYGEYFWIVLDGENVLYVGNSEVDAHRIAECFDSAKAFECCRLGKSTTAAHQHE